MATGKNLSRHRKRLSLTLDQLSDISGVERGTIGALEVRDSKRSDFFGKLAKALGMTIEQLEDENYMVDGLSPDTKKPFVNLDPPQPTEAHAATYAQIKAVVAGVLNAYSLDYADLVRNEKTAEAKITEKLLLLSNTNKPVVPAKLPPSINPFLGHNRADIDTPEAKKNPRKRAEGGQ